MSNARNLANLLGTNTTIQTAKLADDAITAAKLKSDAIQHLDLPSGSVLQAVKADYATANSFTGTNIYLGLQVAITPKSTSSKLLCFMTLAGLGTNGTGRVEYYFRHGTTGGDNSGSREGGVWHGEDSSVSTTQLVSLSTTVLITPATTSTYYVKAVGHKHDGGTAYYNHYNSAESSIHVLEIAG